LNLKIAPGFESSDWNRLALDDPESQDWPVAIRIFEARLRGRFIAPAEHLIAFEANLPRSERRFGFSVMAIECLLIETLQAFILGLTDTRDRSAEMFVGFLTYTPSFSPLFTTKLAKTFYEDFRCGIHHQAEIGRFSRVVSEGPLLELDGRGLVINRNEFHRCLTEEFAAYVLDLATSENNQLRANFRRKMDHIASFVGSA